MSRNRSSMPVIGISVAQFRTEGNPESFVPAKGPPMKGVRAGYFDSVEAAGALPIGINLSENPDQAARYVDMIDGLLLTGGEDVDPSYFGEPVHPKRAGYHNPVRDAFEFALIRAAFDKGIPVFGVCRGAQLLMIHSGAKLVQNIPDLNSDVDHDIDHENRSEKSWYSVAHELTVPAASFLRDETGIGTLRINSLHGQGAFDFGPNREGLQTLATTSDGIVELFDTVRGDRQWIFGTQGHPEAMVFDYLRQGRPAGHAGEDWLKTFTLFADTCRN